MKVINSLTEQNKFLSSTNGLISQADDDNLDLYANRYENKVVDSLSHIKIVKIESLNAQENLTADIIDSHSDEDVQEVIPDSNRQNLSNGNINEINLNNIEETTNDICHQESANVIETSIENKFPFFKWKDLKEISNNKLQTKIISNHTSKILKQCFPLVRLERISVPESNIISSSNAKNIAISSSNTENDMIPVSIAENNKIPPSNTETDIISGNTKKNNIISSSNTENIAISSSNAENDMILVSIAENNKIPPSNTETDIISGNTKKNNIISSSNTENKIIFSNNAKKYNCKKCNRFFASLEKLKSHKQYRHKGRLRYKCEQCDYASNQKSDVIHHNRQHTGECPYQCFYCLFTFKYRPSFKSHLFIHIDKNLSCDICHEKFTKDNLLITHMIYYHSFSPSVKARQCKICRELFPDRYSLKIHIETHKNGSLFKCHICCYTTKLLRNIWKHVNNHVNNRFICNDCGRSLKNKNGLTEHWYLRHNFAN
ncbi:zinc finger protein 37-like isoform X2 [Microplitis mediator]|nr:zinc finger protein 37-like isoform X2 [Microplitis mediator]